MLALSLLLIRGSAWQLPKSGQIPAGRPQEPLSSTAFLLDTIVTVTIYDSADETLPDDALELCRQYEHRFSRTLPDSEIYRLNHGTLPKSGDAFLLSEETARLIERGLSYGRLSGGAFDITIAPVSALWDFTSDRKSVPADSEINAALRRVGYEAVDVKDRAVTFRKEGMELELGGIAKGYIADRMKEFLVSQGVRSAVINLGGNVLCIGGQPDKKPFHIGIRAPIPGQPEALTTVSVSGKSVVSSGSYERFFEKDGTTYHHLLNPATGKPCDNGLLSVTIVSDSSADGDALSTACFVLGLERGMELVDSLPGTEALFLTKDGRQHPTRAFPYTENGGL